MQKGFSLINIFLIIGIIALVYIGYNDYYLKKDAGTNSAAELSQEGKTAVVSENNNENAGMNEIPVVKDEPSPAKIVQPKIEEPQPEADPPLAEEPEPAPPAVSQTDNGYYENTTYKYAITVPASWPLKIRKESDISLGRVPPKDGQGAVSIEVSQEDAASEIEQIKAEVAKYGGLVTLTETPISLAGVAGTKLVLNNSLAKRVDVYILLEKGGFYYFIKYSQESAEFTQQAEAAVKTFKFTK